MMHTVLYGTKLEVSNICYHIGHFGLRKTPLFRKLSFRPRRRVRIGPEIREARADRQRPMRHIYRITRVRWGSGTLCPGSAPGDGGIDGSRLRENAVLEERSHAGAEDGDHRLADPHPGDYEGVKWLLCIIPGSLTSTEIRF